jgi:hypothetical protein
MPPIDPKQMSAFVNEGEEPSAPGESAPPDASSSGAGKNFDTLVHELEEYIDDVQAAADELDPDLLADPSIPLEDDDQEILIEGIQGLDRSLQKCLTEAGHIDIHDGEAIAQQLVDAGVLDDPERVAGWLVRVSDALHGPHPGSSAPGSSSDSSSPSSSSAPSAPSSSGAGSGPGSVPSEPGVGASGFGENW